ncbi:MAG: hypothetical protein OEU32_12165, partial [Acidimicrobiia bacterium]|nr:hypothetical protein [Acidimicrobiia bacterium]
MTAGRPASLVATCDQWVRATHLRTAVDGAADVLTLAWTDAPLPPAPEGDACIAPGLAIDRLCRVYRLEARALWRLRVGPTSAGLDYATLVEPTQIIGEPDAAAPSGSDFAPAPNPGLRRGVGIAIDRDDRLFLADADAQTISVLDLWSRRLLRQVRTDVPGHPDRHPMGLAADGSVVYAVVRNPSGLLRLSASRGPTELALPASVADLPPGAEPSRIAVLPDGEPVMLWHDETGDGWLVSGLRAPRRVGPASDIAVDAVGAVVIAPCPSPDGRASLRRLVATADDWTPVHPLDATGYDGSGLVATADGRVGYFTAAGFRLGVVAPVTYASDGRCVTYRLDSGVARNRWGRVLLEACVPDGTECLVGAATSDDEFETETVHVAASPAACLPATPSATPDLPPDRLVPAIESVSGRLHRRPGPTTPWWRDETSDRYETFEAPVHAAPGRYLWVTLRLQGNARRTPKVRELRVERTTHMLMRRLPTLYSLDERQERFLHRYLATFDGLLHDLDVRSSCRD